MFTSFYTALTGLNMNAMSINVIGNNLANINTTAFKSSKANFAELVGGSGGMSAGNGNPIQIGLGSTSAGVAPVFSQGSIQYTGRSTDVAISGNGFFVLSTGTGYAYTRAGNFSLSASGELVNADGYKVAGYLATNGIVNTSVPPAPIIISLATSLPPQKTTSVSITANLDSKAAVDSTFSTAVQIFDTLGSPQTISFTFVKTGSADWDWTATIPATATGGTSSDPPVEIGNGSFTFNSLGILASPTTDADLTITGLANGAEDMTVKFAIMDPSGNPRFSSFASASSVSSVTQDGFASSVMRDISIDNRGVIRGIFDGGQVSPLAQLSIANFANVEGLVKLTGSAFVTSPASGEPSIGIGGTGGRGIIQGSALELSNVDIAQEFTSLIIAQRGYQANSRVISATDEIYMEAINLKR